jgi:hypothetical protein
MLGAWMEQIAHWKKMADDMDPISTILSMSRAVIVA